MADKDKFKLTTDEWKAYSFVFEVNSTYFGSMLEGLKNRICGGDRDVIPKFLEWNKTNKTVSIQKLFKKKYVV